MLPDSIHGPFGKYRTPESQAKANKYANLHSHTPLDVAVELAHSGGRYGYPFLRENYEAEVFEGEVRHEGRFSRWLADNGFYDEVSSDADIENPGIVVPVKARQSEHQPNTSLTAYDSAYHCDLREIGILLSKSEDLRQSVAGYLRSEEGQKLVAALAEAGYSSAEIEALAVGLAPEEVLFSVVSREEGAVLQRHRDFYRKARNEAAAYAEEVSGSLDQQLGEQLYIRQALAEEITHLARRTKVTSSIAALLEEAATKEFVRAFYEDNAKGLTGEKARDYQLLEAMKAVDLSTTLERYTELYSMASRAGYSAEEIDAIVEGAVAEAKSKGLKGKAAAAYALASARATVQTKDAEEAEENPEDPKEDPDDESSEE